ITSGGRAAKGERGGSRSEAHEKLPKRDSLFMFEEKCEKITASFIVRHATSDHRFEIRVRPGDGHKALHARRAFAPGDTLLEFTARATLDEPAVHSVQVSQTGHILLEPEFLEYTNHSCLPNVIFDVDQMV